MPQVVHGVGVRHQVLDVSVEEHGGEKAVELSPADELVVLGAHQGNARIHLLRDENRHIQGKKSICPVRQVDPAFPPP
jgi:hypothetical protein